MLLLFSMADSNPKFILYVRKFLKNPLLARKQASIELIHPELGGVDKAAIKAKLAKVMKTKEECINIFGLKAKFGGGRSSGFALIYDSVDARKRYDSKTGLNRVSRLPFCAPAGLPNLRHSFWRALASARFSIPVLSFKTNKRALFNILICVGPRGSQHRETQEAHSQGQEGDQGPPKARQGHRQG